MEWKNVWFFQYNIYEIKNGKGFVKEYTFNGDYLLFEGEYLNGEKKR